MRPRGNQPGRGFRTSRHWNGRNIHANDLCGVLRLNLGVLMHKNGKFSQARTRFDEALTTVQRPLHPCRYRLASMYNLAHLARTQRDAARALELYKRCAILADSIKHVTCVLAHFPEWGWPSWTSHHEWSDAPA